MPENIREALGSQLLGRIEGLEQFNPGSEEERNAINNVVTLYELILKEAKIDNEWSDICNKAEQDLILREKELQIKIREMDDRKKEQRLRLITDWAGIVLPIGFCTIWMHKGFKFEENGVLTSSVFKGLTGNFLKMIKLH